MRRVARACVAGALLILFAAHGTAFAEPRRVLLLHSFGPLFEPWSAVAGRFREELTRRRRTRSISTKPPSRRHGSRSPRTKRPLVDYLRALFADRNLDLVVAMGAPAARFFQKHRPEFFPSTPLLITAADQRTFSEARTDVERRCCPEHVGLAETRREHPPSIA